MQTLRKTAHIFIVVVMLAGNVPHFHSADANRDGEVGLADAILQVRNLAQTAFSGETFTANVENALSAMSIAAGLKKSIKSDRSASVNQFTSLDSPYLISAQAIPMPQTPAQAIGESGLAYESIVIAPDTQPPRSI